MTQSTSTPPPPSSPSNPLEDKPYTLKRCSISFSVYQQTEHEDSEEPGSTRAFHLHPARFTPDNNNLSSNSPESFLSSITPTKPVIRPFISTPAVPFHQPPVPLLPAGSKPQIATTKPQLSISKQTLKATIMADTMKSVPLFYGDYGENKNPAAWFTQFELLLPNSWTDTQRIHRFAMQLMPGESAAEWYQGLTSSHISSFASLKAEFFKCWPVPKQPKLTQVQQKEHIMAQTLKEDEVGERTQEGRTGNYAHVIWAINISWLALGMGDIDGAMIEYALEGIPNLLKDHLKCTYNTWEEFVEDIQNVPNVKLKHRQEDLDKERAHDAKIAKLKAQNMLSTSYLSQQLTQMSMGMQQMPLTMLPPLVNPNLPVTTRGGSLMFNTNRGAFTPCTQLTWAQILERAALVPQRHNTEVGTHQYEVDVDMWHHAYGAQGTPSLECPYPL
ncbi:hypothetical protein BDR03DRAFT_983494 [Suillus americanus]|nr:hypothetical protein BDR03DRAFT_983494 [Suillus americanus]